MVSCEKPSKGKGMQSINLNFQEGEPHSLHPHLNVKHLRCLCLDKLLFDCLTKITVEGDVELSGAKSFKVSSDSLQYIFTLRETAWSDGSPVTAFQYEKAWKEAIKPDSRCDRSYVFYMIKNAKEAKQGAVLLSEVGVKALDNHTLHIELAFPCAGFLKLLAQPIFAPLQNPQEEPVHFNGCFLVDKWERGNRLSLTGNPFFWNRSKVSLDRIDFSFISDPMTAFHQFEKGALHWIGDPISVIPTEIHSDLEKRKILRKMTSSRVFWLHLNTQSPALQSRLIRSALSLALDRKKIQKYILNDEPLFTPLPTYYSLATQVFTEDPEQAQKIFLAGLKAIGLTEKSFPPIKFRYFNHPTVKLLAQHVQEVWQNTFGIKVELECTDWQTFRTAMQEGDFQIASCYERPFYPDPIDFLERFGLTFSNYSQWTNETFQEKISLAHLAINDELRNRYMQEAEDILVSEAPVIPISNMVHFYAHDPLLKGYVFDHSGIADFSYAYLEDEPK
jgi:oligopeptide transport system substrate-binding protein